MPRTDDYSRTAAWARLALLVLALLPAGINVACEVGGENLRVENKTGEAVVVLEDGVPGALLRPGESKEFAILPFDGTVTYEVQAFDTRQTLARRTFTWDEIKEEGGILVKVEG